MNKEKGEKKIKPERGVKKNLKHISQKEQKIT